MYRLLALLLTIITAVAYQAFYLSPHILIILPTDMILKDVCLEYFLLSTSQTLVFRHSLPFLIHIFAETSLADAATRGVLNVRLMRILSPSRF